MEENKFKLFAGCFEKALKEIALSLGSLSIENTPGDTSSGGKKTVIVIGVTGKNKGRVLLEFNESAAVKISENMNMDPLEDPMDKYFFLAEFANIFCGKAVTFLNNIYKGSGLRLTPPAIISGEGMDITTPNIQSFHQYFASGNEVISINVGFEGV